MQTTGMKIPLFLSAVLVIAMTSAAYFLLTRGNTPQPETWSELNVQAGTLYQQQEFFKAARAGRQALEAARRQYPEGEHVAVALSNLAMITLSLGENAEAERLEKESLALRARLFGEEDPRLVVPLHHLAYIYTIEVLKNKNQALKGDAEACLLQAVAIMEKAHGKDGADLVPSLEKLEKFYRITGNSAREQAVAEQLAKLQATVGATPDAADKDAPAAPSK